MRDGIKFVGTLNNYIFSSKTSDFKIASINVLDELEGLFRYNNYGNITLKGGMELLPKTEYEIVASYIVDKKYGEQYNIESYKRTRAIEDMSTEDFNEFMASLGNSADKVAEYFGEKTKDIMNKALEQNDTSELEKVNGIGKVKASKILDKYGSQRDYSMAIAVFGKWGFTHSKIKTIVNKYRNQDLAIKKLNENPYNLYLDRIPGIGFKTIDNKALENGVAPNDRRRVEAYIYNFFDDLSMSGDSYISIEKLRNHLRTEVYNADLDSATNFILGNEDFKVFKKDGVNCVALRETYELEKKTAYELLRVQNAWDNQKSIDDIDTYISEVEKEQGWKYGKQQLEAIHTIATNNVFLLQGYSGTGKSSLLKAVVRAMQANDFTIAQCALSGKAADNLTKVTGLQGMTIHRLLQYNPSSDSMFNYWKKNPLPYDVIILDEVSMVSLDLFYSLVSAIKDGAKLIMVGDSGQLDSIGIGVMSGILDSQVIPTITLTEIHRQAEESAIISHSITYRKGAMPKEVNKEGLFLCGDKKDLVYKLLENEKGYDSQGKVVNNLIPNALVFFKKALSKYSVKDIQIITQTTKNCNALNALCQQIANPKNREKEEYVVSFQNKDDDYVLRVGDKVINTVNNRRTVSAEKGNTITPIYNGNTGIIESITKQVDEDGDEYIESVINFDGIGRVLLTSADLRSIRLGYAITVHKSQGSTIPCVIVVLPFQFMLNSRELVYTAITRTSELCFVISSYATLAKAIKKSTNKVHKTNLSAFMSLEARKRGEY